MDEMSWMVARMADLIRGFDWLKCSRILPTTTRSSLALKTTLPCQEHHLASAKAAVMAPTSSRLVS